MSTLQEQDQNVGNSHFSFNKRVSC